MKQNITINCRGHLLVLDRPKVMGILNLTPDSFSDGGRYNTEAAALRRVEQMLEEGATFIDIGGYSTRPGAADISPEEEIRRIEGITRQVLDRFPQALVSIDTFRAPVAAAMLELGAHLINDISGGGFDPDMYATVARYDAPYILMHIQGRPQTMQQQPHYQDLIPDIWDYFTQRIKLARAAGITDLILDPGFGFGKTLSHNYELFRNLHNFNLLGLPLLIGISRKSMIYKLFDTQPNDILELASALHLKALEQGVSILRVHDVRPAVRVAALHNYLKDGTL